MANTTSSPPQRASVSLRKTNKPLMEKRRRARINDSLSQLKSLVIQGTKKDSSQFNKLEKADILELTVKHLRSLQEQQQQQQLANARDSTLTGKYQAGFLECANEVMRYLGQSQSFSDDVKSRVVHHLASCIQLSNKTFSKTVPAAIAPAAAHSVITSGLQTNGQFASGQVIQIVNGPFQNMKPTSPAQPKVSQPVPIAPAASGPSIVSTTTRVPVISSDPTGPVAASEPARVRFTQPLHIQIPPVLSPVIIQSKVSQHQKQTQPQVIHKVQDSFLQNRYIVPQDTLVSSSTTSPQSSIPSPTATAATAAVVASTAAAVGHKSSIMYYTPEDHYADLLPRSRTYSLTSSASSESSDLTSPLNLSQSPHYYDHHRDTNNQSSPLGAGHLSQTCVPDKASPFSRNSLYAVQLPFSSNFPSVIVDGRKALDNQAMKYFHVMDEDRICFRHDGTSSPASSVGEERLWRPW